MNNKHLTNKDIWKYNPWDLS